jgi:hypothetical protein
MSDQPLTHSTYKEMKFFWEKRVRKEGNERINMQFDMGRGGEKITMEQ